MTDLREELARVLFERHYKHAGGQAYMIAKERENWRLFLPEVAAEFMPIIERHIARVRAEERERCAKVADTVPIETYASPPYIAQAKQVRLTVAAAIRAMGDE